MGTPRSRRRLRLLRTVVVATLLVLGIHHVISGGGSAAQAAPPVAAPRASAATSTTTVATDPFDAPAVRSYLADHHGITAAVHDLRTGAVWGYQPDLRPVTASIMKVDILETLLHQQGVLRGDQLEDATGMIENSSNGDAQGLWDAEGGASAVSSYGELAGLDGTRPDAKGYWGLTTTTARDQVRLLDHLAVPSALLSTSARRQALGLMHDVEADQRWGVSAGLPAGTSVAIKNGWLPLDSGRGWQVNSDGIVTGHGYDDDISVLTTGAVSEKAGIRLIEGLATRVWSALAPTR